MKMAVSNDMNDHNQKYPNEFSLQRIYSIVYLLSNKNVKNKIKTFFSIFLKKNIC